MHNVLLFLAAFLASLVEMVEALTIVLAVGVTRTWRPALLGVGAGFLSLAVVIAALGPALIDYVPIDVLRVLIGALLLVFGLQWLRKAILRASGRKALHDEESIFRREVAELEADAPAFGPFDWTGFTVSFKGVFLEGLEVAFIVLTFGANDGFDISISGAVAGFVLVLIVGLLVHRPLSRIPENTIKFSVGLLLTTFGTFWAGEGIGIAWTFKDVTLLILLATYTLASFALTWALKPRPMRAVVPGGH